MFKRFRKKGSIFLFGLLMMMAVFLIAGIFINLGLAYEVMNRVQNAADMGAKVRAQAVDIALKERYGYIETFHDGSSSYTDNVPNRSSIPATEDGYSMDTTGTNSYQIYNPDSEAYLGAKQDADGIAKVAMINYMNDNVGTTTTGLKMVNLKSENICFDVKALPTASTTTMNFSCTAKITKSDGTIATIPITVKNVKVNGTSNPINQGSNGQKVMNVVFVAVAYEQKNFIWEELQTVFHGSDQSQWSPPPEVGS